MLRGVVYSTDAVLSRVVHNRRLLALHFQKQARASTRRHGKGRDFVPLAIHNLQYVGLLVGDKDPVGHLADDYGGLGRAPSAGDKEKAGRKNTNQKSPLYAALPQIFRDHESKPC